MSLTKRDVVDGYEVFDGPFKIAHVHTKDHAKDASGRPIHEEVPDDTADFRAHGWTPNGTNTRMSTPRMNHVNKMVDKPSGEVTVRACSGALTEDQRKAILEVGGIK